MRWMTLRDTIKRHGMLCDVFELEQNFENPC